jgi:hypothetical protein
LICDNLNLETGEGYLIKFSFNNIGLIDAVTYMGSEEIVLQSLWSFVGMHENYLNSLTSRFASGIIPNVVEFLSENWAIALYHEWFTDFCLRMRESNQQMADIQVILEEAFELTKSGKGISREQLQELSKNMGTKSARMIKDETLEFIKTNMNHLPMYYVPDREFK